MLVHFNRRTIADSFIRRGCERLPDATTQIFPLRQNQNGGREVPRVQPVICHPFTLLKRRIPLSLILSTEISQSFPIREKVVGSVSAQHVPKGSRNLF
jgi:hypothetical protein